MVQPPSRPRTLGASSRPCAQFAECRRACDCLCTQAAWGLAPLRPHRLPANVHHVQGGVLSRQGPRGGPLQRRNGGLCEPHGGRGAGEGQGHIQQRRGGRLPPQRRGQAAAQVGWVGGAAAAGAASQLRVSSQVTPHGTCTMAPGSHCATARGKRDRAMPGAHPPAHPCSGRSMMPPPAAGTSCSSCWPPSPGPTRRTATS